MDSKKQKELSDILQQFNRQVSRIFKIVDAIVPDEPNVDWARRIIKIFRNENPPAVLEKCIDKLWDNKDHIMSRDVNFFKTCSFDKYIKKDENKEWLDRLIVLMRTRFFDLSKKEQNCIWECLGEMLKNVIKYKITKGDFVK